MFFKLNMSNLFKKGGRGLLLVLPLSTDLSYNLIHILQFSLTQFYNQNQIEHC